MRSGPRRGGCGGCGCAGRRRSRGRSSRSGAGRWRRRRSGRRACGGLRRSGAGRRSSGAGGPRSASRPRPARRRPGLALRAGGRPAWGSRSGRASVAAGTVVDRVRDDGVGRGDRRGGHDREDGDQCGCGDDGSGEASSEIQRAPFYQRVTHGADGGGGNRSGAHGRRRRGSTSGDGRIGVDAGAPGCQDARTVTARRSGGSSVSGSYLRAGGSADCTGDRRSAVSTHPGGACPVSFRPCPTPTRDPS